MNIRYSSLHPLSFFFFFALKIHIHTQVIYFFFCSISVSISNTTNFFDLPMNRRQMDYVFSLCPRAHMLWKPLNTAASPQQHVLLRIHLFFPAWILQAKHLIEQKALLVSGEGWLRWQQRTNMGLLNARMWTDTQTHLISIIFCDIH